MSFYKNIGMQCWYAAGTNTSSEKQTGKGDKRMKMKILIASIVVVLMLMMPLTSIAGPASQSKQDEKQVQGGQKVPTGKLPEPSVRIGSLGIKCRETYAYADDMEDVWPDGKGQIEYHFLITIENLPEEISPFCAARFEVTLTDDETGETITSKKWVDYVFMFRGYNTYTASHPIELEIGNGEPREITVYMSVKRIFPPFPLGGYSEDTGHLTIYFE